MQEDNDMPDPPTHFNNNMVVFFISDFDTLTLLADGTEPKIPSSHQPSPYMGLWYIGSLFYLSSICSSAFGGHLEQPDACQIK